MKSGKHAITSMPFNANCRLLVQTSINLST